MADAANVLQRGRATVLGVIVFLGVMALVGGVFLIARNERQFAMQQWETRLKAVSAQPLVRVDQWLNESHAALHAVAHLIHLNLPCLGHGVERNLAAEPAGCGVLVLLLAVILISPRFVPIVPSNHYARAVQLSL